MTCLEKWKLENSDGDESAVLQDMCPDEYDIMDEPEWCNPTSNDPEICKRCWNRQVPEPTAPTIKDSGTRQEFPTGAVRDIQEGKGRCDLLPLDVVGVLMNDGLFHGLATFQTTGDALWLEESLKMFMEVHEWNIPTMILEVSMHFEEGAEKYGENNWQKGLPVKCYINSAVRHYLKFLREDSDERHDRAFCWNILCAIWTCKHKPELNEYGQKICPVCGTVIPDGENDCPHCRVFIGKPTFDPDDFMGEYEEEND